MTNDIDGLRPLTERVNALERENHRLRGAGAVALAVVVALAAMGADAVHSISAQKLTIQDASGSVTITGSDILMKGPDGTERAFFGLSTQNNPNLLLYGTNGKLRAALVATDLPYFTMYDAADHPRINVQLTDSNVAKMWLEDTSGRATWIAP